MNASAWPLVKALRDGTPIPPDVFDEEEVAEARLELKREQSRRGQNRTDVAALPKGFTFCRGCGRPAPDDLAHARVLGKDVGATCDACLPAARQTVIREQLESAGVPALYREAVTSEGEPYTLPPGKWWTILMGSIGTGKTFRAAQLIIGSWNARFISWPQLIAARKRSFSDKNFADPVYAVRDVTGPLVIDDLGAEQLTDLARDTASQSL